MLIGVNIIWNSWFFILKVTCNYIKYTPDDKFSITVLDMAQEQLNAGGFHSLQWIPKKKMVKCIVNPFCSIKVENTGDGVFLIIQEGNSRIRMRKDTFNQLYEYKESIQFLMSFLESNSPKEDNNE